MLAVFFVVCNLGYSMARKPRKAASRDLTVDHPYRDLEPLHLLTATPGQARQNN
jgi:hypothetical protein